MTTHRLLVRLHRDLKELLDQPYPGVAVFTDDADIRKFCLVLTPPSGPWTGLSLHFDVVLPDDWPASPPSVKSSVDGIDHPNLFGSYICCDLLKPLGEIYLGDGYTGGYTPALTLRGLFLQFLTFFSSTKVEQDWGGAIDVGDHKIVGYLQERYLSSSRVHEPWEPCSQPSNQSWEDIWWLWADSETPPPCSCWPLQPSQSEMAAMWDADKAPAVVVNDEQPSDVARLVKQQTLVVERINRFEKVNPRWTSTLKSISSWTCQKCPYGTPAHPHARRGASRPSARSRSSPSALHLSPPSDCQLEHLNDDVLIEVAHNMTTESIISFGKAYSRFHNLASSLHLLVQRELHCFFLKTPLRDCTLGIGVAFDAASRTLSSDFDWISLEAFEAHEVRRGIEKREFQYYLPLAFNKVHFEKATPEIWKRLRVLDGAVREAEGKVKRSSRGQRRGATALPHTQPQDVVKVIYKMMNNIVVALMKSCDDALKTDARRSKTGILMASEKAIISYTHLVHLLTCLCRTYPVILHDARLRLHAFVKSPANRGKDVEPDLGELVVVMTLVLILTPRDQPPSWSLLNGPFLEEALTRNARWVLKASPELEVMEQGASVYRLKTTFKHSATSLRLLMFQITFLDLFTRTYHATGIKALDENYGFPVKELPEKMVEEIKEIYKVDAWMPFFAKVKYAQAAKFTREGFTGLLRGAIEKSEQKEYHRKATRQRMEELVRLRKSLDPGLAPIAQRRA